MRVGLVLTYAYPPASNRQTAVTPTDGMAQSFANDPSRNIFTNMRPGGLRITFRHDVERRLSRPLQTNVLTQGGTHAEYATNGLVLHIAMIGATTTTTLGFHELLSRKV